MSGEIVKYNNCIFNKVFLKEIIFMELKDKISCCSGADFWHTKPICEETIPAITMSDGPNGIRKQTEKSDNLGMNRSEQATCFPSESILGCSFDCELAFQYGRLLGEEALAMGVDVVLGPGLNIKRNPLCGRNFEYLSEDPLLAGKLGAAYVNGMQSTGTGACIKHFACNSQEYFRICSDSVVDDRALREIYLYAFEIAVKESDPQTLMAAYNLINGTYCCSSKELLKDILRDEWGFKGTVISDWGAVADRADSFEAGCDLIMPGGNNWQEDEVEKKIRIGKLSEKCVNSSFQAVSELAKKHVGKKIKPAFKAQEHHDQVRKIAEECAVLLKNQDNILPLRNFDDVCFVGSMASDIRYQGAGSSKINPTRLDQITEIFPNVPYAKGYDENGTTSAAMIEEAVKLARRSEKVIVFLGLPPSYESEGFDRENMKLPQGQNELIRELLKINHNIIVVLFSGSAVEMEFADDVSAILYMGLPGQAGAEATTNLLLGKSVPAGKLAETWPMHYEDCISSTYYGRNCSMKNAQYRESIYVGYRYFDKAEIAVRYPFGWGLSYTEFKYSELSVSENGKEVAVTVKNVGKRTAKEAVLLYISPPEEQKFRPKRELKGFDKVTLNPGEEKRIKIDLDERSYAVWNDGWKVYGGNYTICIDHLCRQITIDGEEYKESQVPKWYLNLEGVPTEEDFLTLYGKTIPKEEKRQYSIHSTVSEMMESSLLIRFFYKMFEFAVAKENGRGTAGYKGTMIMAQECPIRGVQNNLQLKGHLDEAICEWANGNRIKALGLLVKRG